MSEIIADLPYRLEDPAGDDYCETTQVSRADVVRWADTLTETYVQGPFELYASGRTAMRLRLSALPRSALLELIAAYGLNPAGKSLAWLRHHQLVTFIVTAVEVQAVSRRRAR